MKNYMDLTGRVAIVTGASSGLGYEYCKAWQRMVQKWLPLPEEGKAGKAGSRD